MRRPSLVASPRNLRAPTCHPKRDQPCWGVRWVCSAWAGLGPDPTDRRPYSIPERTAAPTSVSWPPDATLRPVAVGATTSLSGVGEDVRCPQRRLTRRIRLEPTGRPGAGQGAATRTLRLRRGGARGCRSEQGPAACLPTYPCGHRRCLTEDPAAHVAGAWRGPEAGQLSCPRGLLARTRPGPRSRTRIRSDSSSTRSGRPIRSEAGWEAGRTGCSLPVPPESARRARM